MDIYYRMCVGVERGRLPVEIVVEVYKGKGECW